MAKEIIYLTAEGYKKLKDELDHMRSVERPAISAAIAEARDKGDLSENAEYDAARDRQGFIEGRISELEAKIANAHMNDMAGPLCADRHAHAHDTGADDADAQGHGFIGKESDRADQPWRPRPP